ncbi:SDR family NAD(P)-dependent oxidoreductase [Sphingomonas profundi]|uniref:SDR family NAD(P)-dependent oxidoreductase n=1 Tax=Alterirhizorhabdus profundi TaxID=2681549 RepID=UPI0012E8C705|nr:SDR family NAD(P)-dependent oxidoreductase [Sphingomonas profundi]
MDLGLNGKRAIVTGSSRGIGRAIAEHLLAEGAAVAICARRQDEVDEAVATLSATGGRVIGRAVDVGDEAANTAWIEDAAAELGGLDIFVPNVSVGGGPEKWREVFEVDVMATVRGCEAAVPHIAAAGGGAIVLISTTAAFEVWRAPQAYGVMKAGMINYAKNLSDTVAKDNVRVNTVAPGPVYFAGGAWPNIETQHPDFFREVSRSIPLGRMGAPADVARAVTFLVSDAAAYITGVTLTVDGGRTRGVDF